MPRHAHFHCSKAFRQGQGKGKPQDSWCQPFTVLTIWAVITGTKNWGWRDRSFLDTTCCNSKRAVTSTQVCAFPAMKQGHNANTHPAPRPLCTSEGCKVSANGNWVFDELHQLCQPAGQRIGELEKIKLAVIDPLRITDCRDRLGLHTGARTVSCCATPQQTQQPPWEPCTRSTLLSFTEAWLQGNLFSSPFRAAETNTHPGTQVTVPDRWRDLDTGTVGVKSPKFSVSRGLLEV